MIVTKTAELAARVELYDGIPGHSTASAKAIAQAICCGLGISDWTFVEHCWWLQESEHTCGAVVLAHALAVAAGTVLPQHWIQALDFLHNFPALQHRLIGAGGLSRDQQTFQALLEEHGVEATAVEERAKAAVAKVGTGAIAQALGQKNPWQALKAQASKPGCSFKFITSEELQAHIAKRASQKHGTDVPRPKSKKQKGPGRKLAPQALQVDPEHLQLAHGSFVASDGTSLKQLALVEVKAQATGVCFCSPAQAAMFIADGRNLSVDPLALVVTSELQVEAGRPARVSTVRFPAIYAPTAEAVLVLGSLVQLGDVEVQLAPSDAVEVEGVETAVCRISVYRDQIRFP